MSNPVEDATFFFDIDAVAVDPVDPTSTAHPAKYHPDVLAVMRKWVLDDMVARGYFAHGLAPIYRILDPMAGIGRVHSLASANIATTGIEIEEEWASQHIDTIHGDCLDVMTQLKYIPGQFDAICVSPVYGNRMSDHHEAQDDSKRNTYRHVLGHKLSKGSSAGMHFTDAPDDAYKAFHRHAWKLAVELIDHGGIFILNTKDFYKTLKKGEPPTHMRLTDWHIATLTALGLRLENMVKVPTRGNRQGKNGTTRFDYEWVARLRKV